VLLHHITHGPRLPQPEPPEKERAETGANSHG
jgi:hypothetical protein